MIIFYHFNFNFNLKELMTEIYLKRASTFDPSAKRQSQTLSTVSVGST